MRKKAMPYQAEAHPLPLDVRMMNAVSIFLGFVILLISTLWVLRWAISHPAFAVSRIVVEGDTSHQNALTLQANVGSRISGNFFTIDLGQTRAVFESLPWVRRAVVWREFPNRLRVRLQEHRSVGFWGADTESRMLNSEAEVFEANPGEVQSQELPRLIGSDNESGQVLRMYRRLSVALQPLDVVIEEVQLTARGAWQITLDSGAVIELGRGTAIEVLSKLQNFVMTHQQVLSAYQRSNFDRIESVDLRHVDGYAIRLRGVTTVAATQVGK